MELTPLRYLRAIADEGTLTVALGVDKKCPREAATRRRGGPLRVVGHWQRSCVRASMPPARAVGSWVARFAPLASFAFKEGSPGLRQGLVRAGGVRLLRP